MVLFGDAQFDNLVEFMIDDGFYDVCLVGWSILLEEAILNENSFMNIFIFFELLKFTEDFLRFRKHAGTDTFLGGDVCFGQ